MADVGSGGANASREPASPDLQGARILVVDDEEGIRSVLRRLLASAGFSGPGLLLASSAEQAVQLLEREDVDLVLTDHRMGTMTGVELLAWVRRNRPYAARALMTGYQEEQIALGAINNGRAHAFVPKPWDNAGLLATVERLLRQQRVERARDEQMAREVLALAERGPAKLPTAPSEAPGKQPADPLPSDSSDPVR